MSSPRKTIPERTAAPSKSFMNYKPDPKLTLTPDVFTNRHFQNRNNGMYHGDAGDAVNSDIINDIFNRPRQYSTVEVENGCINIRVPCVYSGPNDALIKDRNEDKRIRKSHSSGGLQTKVISSSAQPKQFVRNKFPVREKERKSAMPPFCSVVRSRSAMGFDTTPNPQGYIAKELKPKERKSAVSKIDTKMVWDFEGGKKVPFLAVDYGQELFEQAAATYAAKEKERRLFLSGQAAQDGDSQRGSKSALSSKSSIVTAGQDKPCHDFSKPRFHSSRNAAANLHKALADVNNIQAEIEKVVRGDKHFEPLIMDRATKKLNIHPSKRVYSNLKLIDPDLSHMAQIQSKVLEEIKSLQPLPRPKDSVPDIMDYNSLSYTRIKPKLIPPKTKPPSAVSVNVDQTFHLINSETSIAEKAEKID